MTVNDELAKRIRDGLQHCLPETDAEAAMSCGTCPYCNRCMRDPEHSMAPVSVPLALVADIRRLLTVTAVQ